MAKKQIYSQGYFLFLGLSALINHTSVLYDTKTQHNRLTSEVIKCPSTIFGVATCGRVQNNAKRMGQASAAATMAASSWL